MARNENLKPDRVLRQLFSQFVSRREARLTTLMDTVRIVRERGWTAFAFGGTPRGVFDNGRHYRPRDLDLVFDDEHFSFFESAFERHVLKRNRFGGLHLRIENLVIDAWPLSKTWAFREGLVQKATFENLPKTTFLNIDGIIIEVAPQRGKPRQIHEAGFFTAWQNKTLDINLRENPFPALCVVRTLQLSLRFGFRLSRRLAMYLSEAMNSLSLAELESTQLSHYGRVEFSTQMLQGIHDCLRRHLATVGLFPLALFPVRPDQLELPVRTNRSSDLRGEDAQGSISHRSSVMPLSPHHRKSDDHITTNELFLDRFATSLMVGASLVR